MGRRKPEANDVKGPLSEQAKEAIQFMKNQHELGNEHDVAKVDEAMQKSFQDRYDFIVHQNPKITLLRKHYPFLFEKKHFFAEFSRIAKVDTWKNYSSNLKKYCDTLLFFIPPRNPVKAHLHKCLDGVSSDDNKQHMKCVAALLLMPTFLGENITSIAKFESKKSKSMYPHIVCQSSMENMIVEEEPCMFSLYVEGKEVFNTDNFVEAIYLAIAAYYCFNIQYQHDFTSTAMLIELLLFNIKPDAENVPEAVQEQHKLMILWREHKAKE